MTLAAVVVAGDVKGRRRAAVGLALVAPLRFEAFAPCEMYVTSVVATVRFLKLIVVAKSGETFCVDWGVPRSTGKVLAPIYADEGWLLRVELAPTVIE